MRFRSLPPLLIFPLVSYVTALSSAPPVLHFTIARRGGAFPTENLANLTFLTEELGKAEARFNLTRREVKGNKLVRKAKERDVGGKEEGRLMGRLGVDGRWYIVNANTDAQILMQGIGSQRSTWGSHRRRLRWTWICCFQTFTLSLLQAVQAVDTMTSSRSLMVQIPASFSFLLRWRTDASTVKSNEHPFPSCRLPTEILYLPKGKSTLPISFAHCRPSKSSLSTLQASGTVLGLAPSEHLSQTGTISLLKQLLEAKVIEQQIWSLMLINGHEGVLSIGGTGAEAVELVEQQTREQLDKFGELQIAVAKGQAEPEDMKVILKRDAKLNTHTQDESVDWRNGWKWSKVQGAEGWWQILMQGVWVDGSKVLKNQPVVIDVRPISLPLSKPRPNCS